MTLTFIGVVAEDVTCLYCLRTNLLVTKDQINPLMQVCRDVLRLLEQTPPQPVNTMGEGYCLLSLYTRIVLTNACLCLCIKSSGDDAHFGRMTSSKVCPV